MVWGSTLMLKWVDRFAVIVYIGAAVLAWTAAQMMFHEPMLAAHLRDRGPLEIAITLGVIAAVRLAGFLIDKRRRPAAPQSSREAL